MESFIMWVATAVLCVGIVAFYLVRQRRRDRVVRGHLAAAIEAGTNRPDTQFPLIDETKCLGCGTCVEACPEGDVLGVVSGVALIVNGLRCVGHGRCEEACPVGAIQVGLGDVTQRPDIPVLDEHNETSVPGLFIAGELSGFSLIRNAIAQGVKVVDRIPASRPVPDTADVLVVGAGPAGLAAALRAKERKLSCVVLDQQGAGGTILNYPRRKLVLTQPVSVPLAGELNATEYRKEALLEFWTGVQKEFALDVRTPYRVTGARREGSGFTVDTDRGAFRAKHVVLALGRRGTPRRLGVPGEELPKVTYKLMDAESFTERHILVVGGGDSAVEAAMGLAAQPGNVVTISYRKGQFGRIKKRNQDRIEPLIKKKVVRALFESNVTNIRPDEVALETPGGPVSLRNDDVFVLIGGDPPFGLLKDMGIMFGGEQAPRQAG